MATTEQLLRCLEGTQVRRRRTLPAFSGIAAPHRETCPPTSCTHTQNHALEIRAPAEQQLAVFSVQHGFGVALLEIFLSDDVGMQVRLATRVGDAGGVPRSQHNAP